MADEQHREPSAVSRRTVVGSFQALLGCPDLEDRERRTALDLALVAWRLRSSAAG